MVINMKMQVTKNEDVTLVTLNNVPHCIGLIASIFSGFCQKAVNVDMISQTAPFGGKISICFTVPGDELPALLEYAPSIRALSPDIIVAVSDGNGKILLYDETMRTTPGVAAQVFQTLADANIDVRMVTTSEADISILVGRDQLDAAAALFD